MLAWCYIIYNFRYIETKITVLKISYGSVQRSIFWYDLSTYLYRQILTELTIALTVAKHLLCFGWRNNFWNLLITNIFKVLNSFLRQFSQFLVNIFLLQIITISQSNSTVKTSVQITCKFSNDLWTSQNHNHCKPTPIFDHILYGWYMNKYVNI